MLIGRLGAGAMGQVYLGRSAAGRLVAVKTIRIEFAEEPDFRTRFAQEVAAARRVSGAFTAAVVAADPEADLPWLATAYVPAPSLSTLVRICGPLPVPAVRWLAAGCAEALESIHAAGLVHRDLKPSNVLVSTDGPRVIDFGVARAVERIQLTLTRGAVGTPAYMAPEQARDTRQATTASDVYSLGATMLLAATGHGPYQGDTVIDVLVQLATGPPDLAGLPGDLADIVGACLERDPRGRPTSASVLAHLIQNTRLDADSSELGPELLSGPALALIDYYRRGPRPPGQPDPETDEDDTFGSLPAVSGPGRPLASQSAPSRSASSPRASSDGSPRASSDSAAAAGRTRPGNPRRRRALTAVGSAVAAVILMSAGVAIGAYLIGGRAGSTSANDAGKQSSGPSPTTPSPTIGFPPPGQGFPLPPPIPAGRPAVALLQAFGDSNTIFVVRGAGWLPGQSVTVTLAGVGSSPIHPRADSAGIINYAINQTHEFFVGGLPPGTYHVVVTAAGGMRATASFVVRNPPGS